MKKLFLAFPLISLIALTGCSNNKEELALLQQQNDLLQNQLQQNNEQAQQDKNFENNLKCQERGDILKKQYDNIFSAYYNEYANTCYVKFYDKDNNNALSEASMDSLGPIKTISIQQLQVSVPNIYGGVTYQQIVSAVNAIKDKFERNSVIDYLLAGNVKEAQLAVGMAEGDDVALESLADGYIGKYTLAYFQDPFKTIKTKITTLKSTNIDDKKTECANLESTIKKIEHVGEIGWGVKFLQVFYSPSKNSCLYEIYQDYFASEDAGCGEWGAVKSVIDFFSKKEILSQNGCRGNYDTTEVIPFPNFAGGYSSYNEYITDYNSYGTRLQELK